MPVFLELNNNISTEELLLSMGKEGYVLYKLKKRGNIFKSLLKIQFLNQHFCHFLKRLVAVSGHMRSNENIGLFY